jgi:hypothetical protein
MFIDILDTESERGHREEPASVRTELAEMKQHLVDAGLDTVALYNGMVERAGCAEASLGEECALRFSPPDFDPQSRSGTSGGHIDRVNGNAARHAAAPLLHLQS